MGVLNVTPDSFSDGGRFLGPRGWDLGAIRAEAQAMLEAGADILDVGGESTRPGAASVTEDEELSRVMPVLETLLALDALVSVDTSKPAVARHAIDAGCHMINDVRALGDRDMLAVVADSQVAVCLMHMRGEPRTMQREPVYRDVLGEVRAMLEDRVRSVREAGVADRRICLDPGFGFGKTLTHNLTLLKNLESVRVDDLPMLVGLSRKRMIGALTGKPVEQRDPGSLAAALLAAERGADIVRVHAVSETVDALKVLAAV